MTKSEILVEIEILIDEHTLCANDGCTLVEELELLHERALSE